MHVVEWKTDKSTHVVPCYNQRPDRVEAGMQHNLNHEKFYTKVTDCPHAVMDAATCVLCAAGAT